MTTQPDFLEAAKRLHGRIYATFTTEDFPKVAKFLEEVWLAGREEGRKEVRSAVVSEHIKLDEHTWLQT